MLDFLKPKLLKISDTTYRIFQPFFDIIKTNNNGELPESIFYDDYLIGYLAGAIGQAVIFSEITNSSKQVFIYTYFFEKFFPKKGEFIINKHLEKMANNEIYGNGFKDGIFELKQITVDLGNMEKLRKYISLNYQYNYEEKKKIAIESSVDFVSLNINRQLRFCKIDLSIHSDSYTLGYIFGFSHYLCKYNNFERNSFESNKILMFSYDNLVASRNREDVLKILDKSVYLQNDNVFITGFDDGEIDASEYLEKKDAPTPNKLIKHFRLI